MNEAGASAPALAATATPAAGCDGLAAPLATTWPVRMPIAVGGPIPVRLTVATVLRRSEPRLPSRLPWLILPHPRRALVAALTAAKPEIARPRLPDGELRLFPFLRLRLSLGAWQRCADEPSMNGTVVVARVVPDVIVGIRLDTRLVLPLRVSCHRILADDRLNACRPCRNRNGIVLGSLRGRGSRAKGLYRF